MREFIFNWKIVNISCSWHNTDEVINSPTFTADPLYDTCWYLSLFPRGNRDSDYLSLYLFREKDNGPRNISINYEFSCISEDTSAFCTCFIPEICKTFVRNRTDGFGESHFIRRHELFGRKKNLPKDTLTLRCRMWKDVGLDDEFSEMFGINRLMIERIVTNKAFRPEKSTGDNFLIDSEIYNQTLFSVSIIYYEDSVDLFINPINPEKVKSSTCNITIVDSKSGSKLFEHKCCFFKNLVPEMWRLPLLCKVPPEENGGSDENDFEFTTEFVYSTGYEYKGIEKNWTPMIPGFLSNYVMSCYPSRKKPDCPSICKELWNLYIQKSHCDVELETEYKSFFAHKFVLCARSPVLLVMLTGEMKEKIDNCIKIEDILTDTLEKFLIFLYTDAFEDIEWDTAINLYYAADKYQVERLKLVCSSFLVENANCDRVCELLTLADRHHDYVFKREVYDFIWKNESNVFMSTQWKKLVSEDKDIALSAMLSKYEDKEKQRPDKKIDDIISNHPDVRHDFEFFYTSQVTSDIIIKTPSTSFPAHKIVLVASSSTFKDMFTESCLAEKSIDVFEIEDLEDDIVSQMLFYLYTDSIKPAQWDSAMKLYHAADMFQIQRLKYGCSCFLLKNLRVANVGDLLKFANEKCDIKLKAAVEEYIFLYDEEIFGSDEWATFSKANYNLALETMLSKYKRI